VAADTGGLRHAVVDGVSGYLVKGHDPAEYARRLRAILSDPALARRLGDAAVAHAARFTWEATAAHIGRVYRELAPRSRGAA
jgi:D-inositol-3-phosphate glycosyltransferase